MGCTLLECLSLAAQIWAFREFQRSMACLSIFSARMTRAGPLPFPKGTSLRSRNPWP